MNKMWVLAQTEGEGEEEEGRDWFVGMRGNNKGLGLGVAMDTTLLASRRH